jgi:hypothetical protein
VLVRWLKLLHDPPQPIGAQLIGTAILAPATFYWNIITDDTFAFFEADVFEADWDRQ